MRPNPQEPVDLVTSTDEILNGKLHFLCSVVYSHDSFHWEVHEYRTMNFHWKLDWEISEIFINVNKIEGSNDMTLVVFKIMLYLFNCHSKLIWCSPILLWTAEHFRLSTDVYSPLEPILKINSVKKNCYVSTVVNSFQLIHFQDQSVETANLWCIL